MGAVVRIAREEVGDGVGILVIYAPEAFDLARDFDAVETGEGEESLGVVDRGGGAVPGANFDVVGLGLVGAVGCHVVGGGGFLTDVYVFGGGGTGFLGVLMIVDDCFQAVEDVLRGPI